MTDKRDQYSEAYKEFAISFQRMKSDLTAWVLKNNGYFDEEGDIQGLEAGMLSHFEARNVHLVNISEYARAAKELIDAQQKEMSRLKHELKVYNDGLRLNDFTQLRVFEKTRELINWEIRPATEFEEFLQVCKQTVFWLELAIKRGIKMEESAKDYVLQKLTWARTFSQDKEQARTFFNKKKGSLRAEQATEMHPSVISEILKHSNVNE